MELRHLRYFVAVAEELSFGRAAAALNMSQPPLSKQIKDLEREIGATLFERTKRRVEITAAGQDFLLYAKDILRMADEARYRVQQVSTGEIGKLVIGFTGTTMYDLQEILRSFSQLHPNVEVILRRMSTATQLERLKERSISVGNLLLPIRESDLHFLPIRMEPFVIALPSSHPLAQHREPISISRFAEDNFIATPRSAGTSYYDAAMSVCVEGGFVPRISLEMDHSESIAAFVSIGMGVSLVPQSLANLKIEGVVYKRIDVEKPVVVTALAWRNDDRSPVIRSLVECATFYRQTSVD